MNMTRQYSIVQLIDLPDELLLLIFKLLNKVQLLYSLIGINKQLDRILSDSVFTKNLTLFRYGPNDHIYPLFDIVLDRFCSYILPQIHHKINMLNLELSSMECILLSADYPNLYELGLHNINEETAERVFSNKSPVFDIFNKKIQSLVITLAANRTKTSENIDFLRSVFISVLTVFNNLRYLNFNTFMELEWSRLLSLEEKSPIFFSSTLLKLHVNVKYLNDCLYLLDGRFNQLYTCYIYIEYFTTPSEMIKNMKPLPNMRCFSLMSKTEIIFYRQYIVELIQRMINLEKLSLYICVEQRTFLDGNNLKNDIIDHLPKLNKFIFNIRSYMYTVQGQLLSSEEIQDTLRDLGNDQIISCVDYFIKEHSAQCHFYTYPYTLKYYHNITNSFPGGLFQCVREVSLFDDRPFEHEFFLRIVQAFPLMEELSLINRTPQTRKANNNNEHWPIIEYPHLIELSFFDVDDDYAEEFLLSTNTCLSNDIHLSIKYDSLKRVTHNFTRDATRMNSTKINSLYMFHRFQSSKDFTNYFPHVKNFTFL